MRASLQPNIILGCIIDQPLRLLRLPPEHQLLHSINNHPESHNAWNLQGECDHAADVEILGLFEDKLAVEHGIGCPGFSCRQYILRRDIYNNSRRSGGFVCYQVASHKRAWAGLFREEKYLSEKETQNKDFRNHW